MDTENTIKVTLTKEDIEGACKEYASKEFDEMNRPSFESIVLVENSAVIIYKGYP